MNKIKGYLLEVTTGTYEGNDWAKVKIRSAEIAENKILTYKVDVKKTGDVNKYLDKECNFTFEVVRGKDDTAVLKVTSVEEV